MLTPSAIERDRLISIMVETPAVFLTPVCKLTSATGGVVSVPVAVPVETAAGIYLTSCVAVNNRVDMLKLGAAPNFAVGVPVAVTMPGGIVQRGRVASINADEVGISPNLALPAPAGSTISATAVMVTIPPISAVGRGYTLEISDGAFLTRHVFSVWARVMNPVTPEIVRSLIQISWPAERAVMNSPLIIEQVASDANTIIRNRLQASEVCLDHYWVVEDFVEIVPLAVQKVLSANHGLRGSGMTRSEYDNQIEKFLHFRFNEVLRGAAIKDADGDDKLSASDVVSRRVIGWTR